MFDELILAWDVLAIGYALSLSVLVGEVTGQRILLRFVVLVGFF